MDTKLSTHGLHDVCTDGNAYGNRCDLSSYMDLGNLVILDLVVGFLVWAYQQKCRYPIALAEFIPGILLLLGVLTRISASLISIVMLGAIFLVKGGTSLTGDGGYEFDLILLAACLVVIVAGPGRVSLSYALKKVPRVLQ